MPGGKCATYLDSSEPSFSSPRLVFLLVRPIATIVAINSPSHKTAFNERPYPVEDRDCYSGRATLAGLDRGAALV